MTITISSTDEFFRTEEGFLVRLWHGHIAGNGTPIMAYVAAIRTDSTNAGEALVPIPGPQAVIHEVIWANDKAPKWAKN